MRSVALFLLLLFSTFTVVLSTCYMWQKGKSVPVVLVEEEEDHHAKSHDLKTFLTADFSHHIDFDFELQNSMPELAVTQKIYEIVYLNTPFSPPDAILLG